PYFGSDGYIILAVMFTIGTIGFTGGNVIYYSFMPYLGSRDDQDQVSTWGYMYGFMGGSMLLILHLVILKGPFDWDTNFKLAVIFVTSALWWWGFGALMFKWTPEPEIASEMEWDSLGKNNVTRFLGAGKVAYVEVWKTFLEIRKFKVLAFFLLAYLLFYDGVNTIASMASAFGDSVLRLNQSMNIILLLTVNIVAIPMTFVFGKLAAKKGTKFALMVALLIYCGVAVTAAGFAPLELEGEADAERYDFQFTWDDNPDGDDSTDDGAYVMTTLYDIPYEDWISSESEGDAAFRDAFQDDFPEPDWTSEGAEDTNMKRGLLICLFILAMLSILGLAIMWLQSKEMGWMGVIAAFLLVTVAIFGASFLAEGSTVEEKEMKMISEGNATSMVAAFDDTDDHRFSIIFIGGNEAGASEVGNTHPTEVDRGGPVDWWPTTMRNLVWAPLGISVTVQWIILGLFVGCAMGSAGAQARAMFSVLTPKTRTSEFFGFFGFLGKSAAMIGTFLYGIASTAFDSRVALLTITIVILLGTYLTSKVDIEEGIRVAEEEDARNEAQGMDV
ncbi:MAG: MFS transporter, partial [Candidatus Thermoplasmatota archaeon]|nr:MFS transporter [Candidatus Thermoplasmatota archaeon]